MGEGVSVAVAVGTMVVSRVGGVTVTVRVGVRVEVRRMMRMVGVIVMVSVSVGVDVGSSVALAVIEGVMVGVKVGGSGVIVQVGGSANRTVVFVGSASCPGNCNGGNGFIGVVGLTNMMAKALVNPKIPARTRTVRKFQALSWIFNFLFIALPAWSFTQRAQVMSVYMTL